MSIEGGEQTAPACPQVEGKVRYLPWYMAMFLKQEQIPSFVVDGDFSGVRIP